MLQEHEGGRERIRRLEAALDASGGGRDGAAETAAENLSAYAALLRSHIAKENNVLFPLAERLLSDDDRRTLAAAFERIEEEVAGQGDTSASCGSPRSSAARRPARPDPCPRAPLQNQ